MVAYQKSNVLVLTLERAERRKVCRPRSSMAKQRRHVFFSSLGCLPLTRFNPVFAEPKTPLLFADLFHLERGKASWSVSISSGTTGGTARTTDHPRSSSPR
jgi:hypothetical protein